jgi:hypothetical protein
VIEVRKLAKDEKLAPLAIHARIAIGMAAQFTMQLLVQAEARPCTHGVGVLTPEEAVTRAVAITELVLAAFAERGWTVEVPSLNDMLAEDAPFGIHAHPRG